MSFLTTLLLALAFCGVVLGAAVYLGFLSLGGGGTASNGSPGPRQSFSFVPATPTVPPTPSAPAASPTPSAPPAAGGTYTVKPGESLSLIGQKVGVPWTLIAQANNIPGPDYIVQVGQVLIIPVVPTFSPGADQYMVQSGDTITAIANKVGVDATDLADFNNIADWNSILPGQILYIPGPGWTPLPTPSG
jgi:LysM repeat protein